MPKKKVTPHQERVLKELVRRGGTASPYVRGLSSDEALVEAITGEPRTSPSGGM